MSLYTPQPALSATLNLATLLIKNNHSFFYLDGLGTRASSFMISIDEKRTFKLIITLSGELYLDDTQFSDAESLLKFLNTLLANIPT